MARPYASLKRLELAPLALVVLAAMGCTRPETDAGPDATTEKGRPPRPVLGANIGQPFGPMPEGGDFCKDWQHPQTCALEGIPLSLDAGVGAGAIPTLTEAGTIVFQIPFVPAVDGGFPSGTEGQALFEGATVPGFYTVTGDISCSTSTPGLCTVTKIQGVGVDGGGPVAGYVLTVLAGGTTSGWMPSSGITFAIDLAAIDGGQAVVAVTGNDGGTPVPVHVQGFKVDGLQPSFTLSVDSPPDAASAPASIYMQPAPPNAAASTTVGGTPGSYHVTLPVPLSTGKEAVFEVDRGDGGTVLFGVNAVGSPTNVCMCLAGSGNTESGHDPCNNTNGLICTDHTNGPVYINCDPTTSSNGRCMFTRNGNNALSIRDDGIDVYARTVDMVDTAGAQHPTIGVVPGNATANGDYWILHGQDSTAAGFPNGGPAWLAGGGAWVNGTTGLRGSSGLCLGGGWPNSGPHDCPNEIAAQAFEGVVGHRGLCVGFAGSGCGAADIPNGDGPTIFATLTAPTTCGSHYGDVFTDPSTGKLSYCNRSGAPQTFDSLSTAALTVEAVSLGQTVTSVNTINFAGAGITSVTGGAGTATVTISGGGCNSVAATTGDVVLGTPAACGDTVGSAVEGLWNIAVPNPSGTNTSLTYNGGAFSWSNTAGGITQTTHDVVTNGGGGPTSGTTTADVKSCNGAGTGVCDFPNIPLQLDNVGSLPGASAGRGYLAALGGGGYWVGSGSMQTELAAPGFGTINSQNAHVLQETLFYRTTGDGQTVIIAAPVPTHTMTHVRYEVQGRVQTAGGILVQDDALAYVVELVLNNHAGTPTLLPHTTGGIAETYYTTNMANTLASAAVYSAANVYGVQFTQTATSGGTIDWTVHYEETRN